MALLLLGWPVSAFTRHVLTNATSYAQAAAWLDRARLVAPCYIILAGPKAGEGALYTQNRWGHSRRKTLAEHGPALVQCNTDHWECDPMVDVLASEERRDAADGLVRSLMRARVSTIPTTGAWRINRPLATMHD